MVVTATTSPGRIIARGRPRLWSVELLLIHDVFPDPDDGGRPPYEIYLAALDSEAFIDVASEGSLRALRRVR